MTALTTVEFLTVKCLAQPYADHPGFDPGWALGVPTIRKISKETNHD